MASTDEGSSQGGGVPNQLALLVPSFDPAVDNVDIWSNKISLLVEAWPETKMTELATRLILNTKGSAFQKLHLQQKDLLVNDKKSIKKIVEIVGGTWGEKFLSNIVLSWLRRLFSDVNRNQMKQEIHTSLGLM